MKKLTSVLLAFVMTLSLVTTALADGTTLTVKAPDTLPKAGETFTVTVDISGNPGLCAAQYTLAFDKSVVQCTGVTLGKVLSGTLSATNGNAADGAIVACASTGEKTGDGVLCTYTFKVLKSGDADFSLTDGVFSGADGKMITTNVAKPEPKQTTPTTPATQQQGATQTTTTPTGTTTPAQQEATTAELFGTGSFTDVPADFWGYAEIEKAAALGLVTGNPDGTFAPNRSMTRAEFVTMLRRLSGDSAAVSDKGFADVKAGDWFYDAVNWAAEKGYATGDGVKFNPNGKITRQEVVTILYRYHGATGGMEAFVDGYLNTYSADDNLASFADRGEIASWATDALHWAIGKGLVKGTTDTTVSPTGTANRAQVAAIFVRYAEK